MRKRLRKVSLSQWILVITALMTALPFLIYRLVYSQATSQLDYQIYLEAFLATLAIVALPTVFVIKKARKKEVQESETRRNVAELMDHAADMILITRPSGQIINANRKACEILGYSLEQLKTMQNMDIDLECTLYRTPKMHQQLFEGKTISFESFYRTAKGNKIPVENHVSTAGWMDGNYYLEITRDITRRRLVEKELHASKEALERVRNRLETRMQERTQRLVEEVQKRELTEKRIFEIRLLLENLVNSMPSVIIALDERLRVTQWNLEAEKTFAISEQVAVGQIITQLLPQFKNQIISLVQQSERGRKAIKELLEVSIGDKSKKFNVVLYPLSQTAGSDLPGVVIRLDDITEKARIDEVLVQTEKMLSLGGLAAGMAHEINNPLGAILQSTQNIGRRLSPNFPRNNKVAKECSVELSAVARYLEKQNILEALDAIKEAGERAATIVADMLSFARPSQGELITINIEEEIKSALRLSEKDFDQKRKLDFKNIVIEQYYDAHLPPVKAQKNKLSQVLLNLFLNAAQALASQNENSQPIIKVSARTRNRSIAIEIRDNGPGMDEATRKRVFEPFYTTKEEGKGTGLGLSVSYFIVTEQLGGSLVVDSTPGRGACFTITIPVASDAQEHLSLTEESSQYQLPLE
ncbi:MAG: PAS domain S-box protein [Gammaproteobacteria bacterium]|nr:PAS domain S-box protein [Gammaproteobacteria bacterium]